jgi:dipeptidyl aminopeptidase/acylaminoacyl peptidase
VAIFQPEFLPGGDRIAYVSDETGWGRLVLHDLGTGETREVAVDEFDLGTPAWVQGLRTYTLFPDGARALVTVNGEARITAAVADLDTGRVDHFVPFHDFSAVLQPAIDPRSGDVAAIVSSAVVPPRIVEARQHEGMARVVRRAGAENLSAEALSTPEHVSWASAVSHSAHGLFYPPASERFESDGAPPLVVLVHGGPTSQAIAAWSPQVQFLTSRGYAVLAVNHRGSTGYGRDFMTALRGNWGVLDVEDSVSGAKALAQDGRVDGDRMAIMGGSAGGFTVLQTMIDHPTAFAAGVCLYGVSNQFTLAAETHKFEAHYTDSLLGALPEAAAVYRDRSPQFRASEIRRPLAIFQGAIDEVVPKNQSETIVAALERSGTPHEYHVYEGEGHGWRRAETIEAFYTALDRFLRQWLVYA